MGTIEARHATDSRRELQWDSDGFARPRVMLQPYAAPSILGLYGFAAATFIVALHMTGVYGGTTTNTVLWPFAAIFGGVAQFMAGMWAYRVRDAIATAMHGMWGSFWIAFGILNLLILTGQVPDVVPGTASQPAFAMWFYALAAITVMGALAALAENLGLVVVLGTLATGSALLGVGMSVAGPNWIKVGAWVLVASAIAAWYVASSLMLLAGAHRVVLPLGKLSKEANRPGGHPVHPIQLDWAEPGIKQGQ
jgi:succinate-acetate transporter protein